MQTILLCGSGKVSQNFGQYLLEQGNKVIFLSLNDDQNHRQNKIVETIARRSKWVGECKQNLKTIGLHEAFNEHFDIFIECSAEDETHKKDLFSKVSQIIAQCKIVLSTSSSIFPSQLHPSCIGFHCFLPLQVCCTAELIVPTEIEYTKILLADEFARSNKIQLLRQTQFNAYAVNRLLLPIQNACFQYIRAGVPATIVDECSRSELLPIGQLTLIDSIGIDVVLSAAKNYLRYSKNPKYFALIEGLSTLQLHGILGKKNKKTILSEASAIWEQSNNESIDRANITAELNECFMTTCNSFVRNAYFTKEEILLVVQSVFGSDTKDMVFAE